MNKYGLVKKIGFFLGPLLFLAIHFFPREIVSPLAQKVFAVAAWMIVWWITETVSISVTALLPLVLFPVVGIMDIDTVSAKYGHKIIFLFFGGFVMALALERVGLHKRIALNIVRATGSSPDRVVLGFMIATSLLSMWISNTATTVLMLPIAVTVIDLLREDDDGLTSRDKNFALSLLLAIAFSANIGGVATLIGTPPNSAMASILSKQFDIEISFARWMMIGLPFSLVMLVVCYFVLVKWFYPSGLSEIKDAAKLLDDEVEKLGPISKEEYLVMGVFVLAISAWIAKGSINSLIPGLELDDASVSMIAAFAMFTVPAYFRDGVFLLDWKDTSRLPWGILILFGGGLALASAFADAGIIKMTSEWIASQEGLSVFVVIVGLITLMLFMTELMSNIGLVLVFIPVVCGIAAGLEVPLLHIAIPVTMASSCAFMLPMATPPNAIVFASGHIQVAQMARVGIVLNLLAIVVLIVFARFAIPLLF